MTKTEAIKWLSNLKIDIGKTQHQELWHYEQALDEIIQALEQEPSEDLISRQDVIDGLEYEAKMLSRVLDNMEIVCQWGRGLVECFIEDIDDMRKGAGQ